MDSLHAEVSESIAADGIQELGTQWFAEKAGLKELYSTAYSLLSESAHTNVRDLDALVVQAEDGDVEHLQYGPDVKGLNSVLCTGIEATVLGLEAAFKVLPLRDSSGLKMIRQKMELLFEELDGEA